MPDWEGYLLPIEYLVKQGRYWPDARMPGYGAVYLVGYLLTGEPHAARLLLIGFNFTLTSCAILASAIYIYRLSHSFLLFYLTAGIWLFSSITYYWPMLLTDNPTAAGTAILIILLLMGRYGWAGVLFTFLFFSRPASILIGLPALMIIASRSVNFSSFLYATIQFGALPTVAEIAWIVRNYILYRDFRPAMGNGTTTCDPAGSSDLIADFPTISVSYAIGLPHYTAAYTALCYGRAIDSADFFKLFLSYPLSAQDKHAIASLLRLTAATAAELWDEGYRLTPTNRDKVCSKIDSIERLSQKIARSIYVPLHVRIINRLIYTLFAEHIDRTRSFNPLNWDPILSGYFIYNLIGVMFITFAGLGLIFLGMSCYRRKNVILNLALYLIATIVPIFHILSGIIQQRYLITYIPAMGFVVLIMLHLVGKKISFSIAL
ncbi:MAG: hypothetical protein ABDH91_08260 [Bacteroidia bacterium]